MNTSSSAIATVSILGLQRDKIDSNVMLQRRLNEAEKTEFRGLWELPQGKIYPGENLAAAAERELMAEAGLTISKWINPCLVQDFQPIGKFSTRVASYQPYYCSQAQGTHTHLALAVLVVASGQPTDTPEARGHKWFSASDVLDLLKTNSIFPLDVPILAKWVADVARSRHKRERLDYYSKMANAGVRTRPDRLGMPTICFDLGGVLIGHRHDNMIRALADVFRITPVMLKRLLFGSPLADRLNVGELTPVDVFNQLCRCTATKPRLSSFTRAWERGVKIRTKNVRLLQHLRRTFPELQFAVATNLDVIKHDLLARTAQWYAELDYRHVSACVGDRKPNISYYKSLVDNLGCHPKDVFFVDDKRVNIAAAKRAGLTTFTANRHRPLGAHFGRTLLRWTRSLNAP